jgi:hypothetical protein
MARTKAEDAIYVYGYRDGQKGSPQRSADKFYLQGYAAGQRKVNKGLTKAVAGIPHVVEAPVVEEETDEAINLRITKTFKDYNTMVLACVNNVIPGLVAFGAAGTGKSWPIEQELHHRDPDKNTWKLIKGGSITALGLYRALHEMRHGGTIVVDDCDKVWYDEAILGTLKAALDTSGERWITWETKAVDNMTDGKGEPLPRGFAFGGSVIFSTNKNLILEIEKETKIIEHVKAVMDRCHVIDMGIHTLRETMIRIDQLAETILCAKLGVDRVTDYDYALEKPKITWAPKPGVEVVECEEDVYKVETSGNHTEYHPGIGQILAFLKEKAAAKKLYRLSLRTLIKIADLYKASPDDWKGLCETTICKR